jgi:hypothetical protein
LDRGKPDPAATDHHDGLVRLNLRRPQHGAHAGRDAAAEQRGEIEGQLFG